MRGDLGLRRVLWRLYESRLLAAVLLLGLVTAASSAAGYHFGESRASRGSPSF